MASWTLAPCLVSLRAEVNALAPGRDRASDGSIGDAAHAASKSDHNPDERGIVHAIDLDRDLRTAGWSMDRIVQVVVTRHRSGQDDRLQNCIWNGRIWSRSWGWTARAYTGVNPHDKHAHFSARYETRYENDTGPWGLLTQEDSMAAVTDDQIRGIIREELTAFGRRDPIASIYARSGYLANQAVPGIAKAIAELVPQDVDEDALAAALVARLPEGGGDVTADELQAAIVAAARELIASPTTP